MLPASNISISAWLSRDDIATQNVLDTLKFWVKAHSIMEPLESYSGGLEGAPRADEGADLDQLIDLAVGTEMPVVITDAGQDVGVVTKPRLLRGIQGGKE